MEGNIKRRLRVRVRVKFLLFYSELTPTDLWCNMLRDFTWTDKYKEVMPDEHPLRASKYLYYWLNFFHITRKSCLSINTDNLLRIKYKSITNLIVHNLFANKLAVFILEWFFCVRQLNCLNNLVGRNIYESSPFRWVN